MGHWYDQDGVPRYTTYTKDGKERPTTLADARKNGWVPSVTTVLGIMDKPALTDWRIGQHYEVIFESMRAGYILTDLGAFRADMRVRVEERLAAAPDLGTAIHASLEAATLGQSYPCEHAPFVIPAIRMVEAMYGPIESFVPEQSFCHGSYGGKVDMHRHDIVLDWKTKKFEAEKYGRKTTVKSITYPEHVSQLAAYARGLDLDPLGVKLVNVMISSTVPGMVLVREWERSEADYGLTMFDRCMDLWRVVNKYDPEAVCA